MKTNPYSAAGIREGESRANLQNKPVVNSSKNRLYDSDGDFNELQDRKETKILSIEILAAVKKAFVKKSNVYLWVNGVRLRRKIIGNRIRL